MCNDVLTHACAFLYRQSRMNDPRGGELKHLGSGPLENLLKFEFRDKVQLKGTRHMLGYG